jgi:hypothetical protein
VLFDVRSDAKQLSTDYTAYIVQSTTGFLVANSVKAPNYDTTAAKFILASASSNDVIATSYNYLLQSGILVDTEVKIAYSDPSTGKKYDMTILLAYLKDSTGTNEFQVVYIDLQDPVDGASQTDTDTDDSDDSVASSASVAAATFAGLALLLLVVMSIMYCVKSKQETPNLLGINEMKSNL